MQLLFGCMLILYDKITIIYIQLLTTNLTRWVVCAPCSTRQSVCWSRFVTSIGSCRYHIAGTKGVFYSREPYVNDSSAHVTRFIGLANVGNKEKQVFIYRSSQLFLFKKKENLFVHIYTTFLSYITIFTRHRWFGHGHGCQNKILTTIFFVVVYL